MSGWWRAEQVYMVILFGLSTYSAGIFSLVCFNYRILEIIPDESSLNKFWLLLPMNNNSSSSGGSNKNPNPYFYSAAAFFPWLRRPPFACVPLIHRLMQVYFLYGQALQSIQGASTKIFWNPSTIPVNPLQGCSTPAICNSSATKWVKSEQPKWG